MLDEIIRGGPGKLKKAERKARKLSKLYGEQFEAKWFVETRMVEANGRCPSLALAHALQWRPHFLAALALSHSPRLAAGAAHISPMTAYSHRRKDREFAEQWEEAIETALDLLHPRVFQRCVEGDLEPITCMGVVVGYGRKFDSRLQIESVRAYQPDKFKTAGVSVNVGVRGDVFVLSEDQRHELQRINREWLLSQQPKRIEDTSLRKD